MNGPPLPSSDQNPCHGQERGFALLTVIVIVMALTILGLSLFSLSGFEARFFRPAMDQAQAVQSGRAGVDWARYVLESTDELDSVRIAVRPLGMGITSVIARRGNDFDSGVSIGPVFPAAGDSTDPIWVQAVASQGNQESVVLAQFTPSPGRDLYKRLITVMDSLVIKRDDEADRFGNTLLYGNIRIGKGIVRDYARVAILPTDISQCVAQQGGFPRPELDLMGDWWQQKYTDATYLPVSGGSITLEPGIHKTDQGVVESDRRWSVVLDNDQCIVYVSGTSVWMFPEGLRCNKQLKFRKTGSGRATVILVSRPGAVIDGDGSKEEDVGFALLGGLDVQPNINVFMVSTGGVEIEHHLDSVTEPGRAGYLSIYAGWARLMGPRDPGGGNNADMVLEHGSCTLSPAQDDKDGVVDQLIEQDLLPNSRFARRKLAFVPGTWNENPTPMGN